MANSIATPTVFARAGLKLLKNNLVMARLVSNEYTPEFRKVGDTVKAKRHPEFTVTRGRVAQNQDVLEGTVDVKLDTQANIKVKFNSYEETLSVESLLHSKCLNSAMSQLAQDVDSELMKLYKNLHSWAGTPGEVVDSPADFFEGPLRLDHMAAPSPSRQGVLYPKDYFKLAAYFTGPAAVPSEIGRAAVEKAKIPMIGDVQPYKTQSIVNHVNGAWAGGALVKGANQNVTYASAMHGYTQSLLIDDLTDQTTIKVGDVFTIAGVNAVNPRSKQPLDYLQQFVVRPGTDGVGGYNATTQTYTYSIAGSNDISIRISPPIIIDGAYQTVDIAPANDAAIALVGTGGSSYTQNMVFHEGAFALCVADVAKPFTGEWDIAKDPDTGLSVRYWRYSDGDNDEHAHRYDILFGATCLDNRLGTRLSGTNQTP